MQKVETNTNIQKYLPTILSQTRARSHDEEKFSYSGAPVHMPTLTAHGMNVL